MKPILWDENKNLWLRNNDDRGGIGFEDCVIALETGGLLDILPNPSANHPDQRMFVLEVGDYVYCVPFVESETHYFLKTLFPSRRHKAQYKDRRQ